MIRKQNCSTPPGRRKEQRSSDSTEENGNWNEETQHEPSQSPSHIGNVQENGKELNKRIRWSRQEMKEMMCFSYIKEMTLRKNYKEVYKLWRERSTVARINLDAKALLNQNSYILKAQRLTAVEIDEIRENIRLEIREATEDYTNEVNGDRTDANVIEYQKRNKKNVAFDKAEINKYPSAEGEQHTVKNKLKKDLQIMWHKVRLLHISEREKLPRFKTQGKLIKLQEEINGVIEELLVENEMNVTDINNMIYAAAPIMTQILNEPDKRSKNRRDVKFWKIRKQKEISSWRKELSLLAETGTGSDNVKLNRKKRKIFQKYRVKNAREVAQLTETLKPIVQVKAHKLEGMKNGKSSIVRIRCLKKTLKNFTETWA